MFSNFLKVFKEEVEKITGWTGSIKIIGSEDYFYNHGVNENKFNLNAGDGQNRTISLNHRKEKTYSFELQHLRMQKNFEDDSDLALIEEIDNLLDKLDESIEIKKRIINMESSFYYQNFNKSNGEEYVDNSVVVVIRFEVKIRT